MRRLLASVVATLAFLTMPARAVPGVETLVVAETNQYFSVLGGYFLADKNRDATRSGITGSAIYGYRFTPRFGFELQLMGTTLETGNDRGTDFYQLGGTVDAVLDLQDRAKGWTPFLLLGVGAIGNDVVPDAADSSNIVYNAGLGAVTGPLTRLGFKLRGEGRYQRDVFQEGYDDLRFMAGIEFPFGSREVVLPPLAPPVIEVREVIKEVPVPFVDSDRDTIEDGRDKCPDTPAGLKVDADGCVIEGQALELKGVTFELNSARLQLNAQTVLDYVTKGMQGQPSMTVEIAGHTDSRGSDAYNLKLSQQRAEAVSAYLVAHGIEARRLGAKGYGEAELLVRPEATEVDYERNRRVVFRVIGK